MFFLIGGIQPKTRVIDKTPRLCTACGQMSACVKRVDHYLSLFFIPVFPIKKGEPFIACENCAGIHYEQRSPPEATFHGVKSQCKSCGRNVERGFSFCPYCGRPV